MTMKNGQFKIQHGIPMPPRGSRGYLADALRKMQPGDSIDIYDRPAKNIYPTAAALGVSVGVRSLADKNGKKFIRVWKQEPQPVSARITLSPECSKTRKQTK